MDINDLVVLTSDLWPNYLRKTGKTVRYKRALDDDGGDDDDEDEDEDDNDDDDEEEGEGEEEEEERDSDALNRGAENGSVEDLYEKISHQNGSLEASSLDEEEPGFTDPAQLVQSKDTCEMFENSLAGFEQMTGVKVSQEVGGHLHEEKSKKKKKKKYQSVESSCEEGGKLCNVLYM